MQRFALGIACLSLALLLVAHLATFHNVILEEKSTEAVTSASASAVSKAEAGKQAAAVSPVPTAAATAANQNGDPRKAAYKAFEHSVPKEMRGMLNMGADPCDDFHQWACGAFEKDLVIPPERTGWSYSWDGDGQEILQKLHKIFIHDKNKPGFYYRACMNTPEIDKLGTTPLKPWLKMTEAVKDKQSLAAAIAHLHMAEVPLFFAWFVGLDDHDSKRTLLYFDTGGLTLPDATYYTEEKRIKEHKKAFLEYATKGLTLAGFSLAQAKVMAITTLTIETELASHTDDWTDESETYRYNATALGQALPEFDWHSYLQTLGHADLVDKRIFLTNPPWFRGFTSVLKKFSISDIKMYITSHLVMNVSPLLPSVFLDNNLALDRNLYGIAARTPRWKKCTRATRHALPFLVSKLFVDKYFPPKAKQLALQMMETIRDAFREDFKTVEWMTNSTRQAAIGKLDRIFFEVGYPNQWPQYGFLTMLDTYFDNAMRASEWRTIVQLERLRAPVKRHAWDVNPVTVNAFYYNGVNGVFLPTGILQPPFFDWQQPLAHNYGSIGAIIGHEVTHAFDSTGSQFNANGERRDWWDQKTLDEFDARKQCVRDYYSSFEIYGEHVSGMNTLDEDIADIGGLKLAYRAYLLAEQRRKHLPTMFERRMFWTAFAQTWCGVTRKEALLVSMLTDEHAPDRFRIIGALAQNPDFAKDFMCPVGTKMNPKQRCVLW